MRSNEYFRFDIYCHPEIMLQKPCSRCHIIKVITEFYVQNSKPGGRASQCKSCDFEYAATRVHPRLYCKVCDIVIQDRHWNLHVSRQTHQFNKAAKDSIAKGDPVTKMCNTCNEKKTMDHYASGVYRYHATQSRCSECTTKRRPPRKPHWCTVESQIAKKALDDSIARGKPLKKCCNTCNKKKTVNLFPSGKYSRRSARCSDCTNKNCTLKRQVKRKQLAARTQSGRDQAVLTGGGLFNY